MKHFLPVCVCAALLLPTAAAAGPLYGTVRKASGPGTDTEPAAGVVVVVTCPGKQAVRSEPTGPRGSFSVLVLFEGRCRMRATKGDTGGADFDVFVSSNPVRFDLVVDASLNRSAR